MERTADRKMREDGFWKGALKVFLFCVMWVVIALLVYGAGWLLINDFWLFLKVAFGLFCGFLGFSGAVFFVDWLGWCKGDGEDDE